VKIASGILKHFPELNSSQKDIVTYEKPGKYRILVKVVDIFGNDTSQAFEVEV